MAAVRRAVTLPIAVKLSPYFCSPGNMALRLIEAGADGLVLFNRFLQPEVDVEALAVRPSVALSSPVRGTAAAHLDRRPVGAHRGLAGRHLRRRGCRRRDPLPAGRGRRGDDHLGAGAARGRLRRHALLAGLQEWMLRRGYSSVADFRGLLAVPADADSPAYLRAGYVAALENARRTYGSLHR